MAQAFRLKEKADRASERKSVEERDKEYYAEDSVNWDKPVLDYDTLNRQPWVAYGEIDEGAHILFAFVQLGNRAISFGRVISFGIRVPMMTLTLSLLTSCVVIWVMISRFVRFK